MGAAGFRRLSFLLTHACYSVADRCPVWRDDPARQSVSPHVGSVRDYRLAITDPDCLHDRVWSCDGKDRRGSIPGRSHCERHGPVWSNRSTRGVLYNDSCSYAADVKPGGGSRHAADIDQNCSRTGIKPENICNYGDLRGFVLLPDAARACVRPGLHTRTLSLSGLRESWLDPNDRCVCYSHVVGAGIL